VSVLAKYRALPEYLQRAAERSALSYVWDHYQLSKQMEDPLMTEAQSARLMDEQYTPIVKKILDTKYFDAHGTLCMDVQRIKDHEEQQRALARAQRIAQQLERAISAHAPAAHPASTPTPTSARTRTSAVRGL
jgi:predicted secreted Zn-dependent protease